MIVVATMGKKNTTQRGEKAPANKGTVGGKMVSEQARDGDALLKHTHYPGMRVSHNWLRQATQSTAKL